MGVTIAFFGVAVCPGRSQVVPDATLPTNSTVTVSGNVLAIDGGTQSGSNLFHSFTEFGIPTDTAAVFNNAAAVDNIITRVTGGNISNIDGVIRATGSANLFLINPNGIHFGENAAIDIGGSFIGSTANAIAFADGTVFDAVNPQPNPILTVSVPVGLQFGATPGAIETRSRFSLDGETNSIGLPTGLQVRSGNTLALIGGNLLFDNGNLTALEGRIELGSVAGSGEVKAIEIEDGWTFDYTGIDGFAGIQVVNGSAIDTSGVVFSSSGQFDRVRNGNSGSIRIRGENVAIANSSLIATNAIGFGGGITVTAASLEVSGRINSPILGMLPAGLFAQTWGTGRAGDINIETNRLIVRNGGQVSTSSFGSGRGGDLTVTASDFVEIRNFSSLLSEARDYGNGGNIIIGTHRLVVRNFAEISATTFALGRGGDIVISGFPQQESSIPNPTEVVEVRNTARIITQVNPGATGNAGNLTIVTEQLRLENLGLLVTSTFGEGNAGSILVNAFDSVDVLGTGITPGEAILSSRILSRVETDAAGNGGSVTINAGQVNVANEGQISVATGGSGSAGDITLHLERLFLGSGGKITAESLQDGNGGSIVVNASESIELNGTAIDSEGQTILSSLEASASDTGNAGNITVTTPELRLDNGAAITTDTANGDRGNVTLNTQNLRLRRNSNITTNATATATGGNIDIETDTLVALEDSNITANAVVDFAGQININTEAIFLEGIRGRNLFRDDSPVRSDITASSGLGVDFDGMVVIQSPNINPGEDLPEEAAIVPIPHPADPCVASSYNSTLDFDIIGRGGAIPTAIAVLGSYLEDIEPEPVLVEAQGWIRDDRDRVKLVADAPILTRDRHQAIVQICGGR
mgnify:CR=1 FL=1